MDTDMSCMVMEAKSAPTIAVRRLAYNDRAAFEALLFEMTEFNHRHSHTEIGYNEKLLKRRKSADQLYRDRDRNKKQLVLIGEMNNVPVAYAIAFINEEHQLEEIGFLSELYVREEARQSGLGSQLLDGVIHWLRRNDIEKIRLSVYSWNDKAKEFYERQGFSEAYACYEKVL